MAIPDAGAVRRVRCPRCHCVLEEPGAPVYQCGGCGASLRAKNRTGTSAGDTDLPPPPQSSHLDASDVATTSRSRSSTPTPPDVGSSSRSGTPTPPHGGSTPNATATGHAESADPVPPRNRVSDQVALVEKRGREQTSAAQEVHDGSATRNAGGNRDATSESLDDSDKRTKRQIESTDAARKRHSGEAAAQPQYHQHQDGHQQLAPKPSAAQPARGQEEEEDAGEKAPSPSRRAELQEQHLGPLRKKILKTVDELKGDLSQLFSKSPELNAPRARPPRLPKQEGYVSRAAAAAASVLPARARHAAAATDGYRGSAARAPLKPRQAAAPPPRGLPSRRYRQCRAHPGSHDVEPRSCSHGHGCCRHHGKPECSSCRGYCCRPRAQPPAAKDPKRRLAPRNHCRPVLKGAPFIVCSSCFKLVQVPADFAVSSRTVRKLRCGSCSTVLSYSYRDPARKKAYQDSVDRCSTVGSELHGGKGDEGPDPFAPFIDGFGLSSYSTEDEQRLPVSRNTSFDTLDGTKGVGRLHRLMGYGSASELLRHSPDLYESFSERTTPDVRQHDRKGKAVCIDDDDDNYDVDDSDEEEYIGALKRSAAKGSGWSLPWMPGKGTPATGGIRIR
ncbi:uncharacterized protein LOC100275369 [Zea mays]|uniref:Uncharacterized protein n=1 Tax=Zea mays TaxID=4577 RepID=B6SS05_MAIZE|nr:uncharacterized protein LOC100275369 [Zea mays]ACG27638.1 hypothetical protein [Zea mays]ONM26213.1 hypothetical protein ZEAMMB73_Zm00001d007175 [Zea mays]|eukprot:NP_001142932.1 uncharacterized protein LOC100275369 [Zea mays]